MANHDQRWTKLYERNNYQNKFTQTIADESEVLHNNSTKHNIQHSY
jgi:hypothetical protein